MVHHAALACHDPGEPSLQRFISDSVVIATSVSSSTPLACQDDDHPITITGQEGLTAAGAREVAAELLEAAQWLDPVLSQPSGGGGSDATTTTAATSWIVPAWATNAQVDDHGLEEMTDGLHGVLISCRDVPGGFIEQRGRLVIDSTTRQVHAELDDDVAVIVIVRRWRRGHPVHGG